LGCHVWLRLGRELPDGEAAALSQRFPHVSFTTGETLPADSRHIDVLFTNGLLPDDVAARLNALKWIHTTFGGGMSFRTPSVVERGITVTSSRGVQAVPLAEFTEACVLALAKKFPTLWQYKQERRWDETLRLDTLAGQAAGLLGLGVVNALVAQRLHDRGLRVHAIRRNLDNVPSYVDSVSGWDQLPKLLAEVDFLIVALPASERFYGKLGEAELRAMKPTSHIINLVTRGIIPDAVLLRALSDGWIAGAACNVFETNPLPAESPLWSVPNLIISPNIAQGDRQRWRKLRDVFTENLQRYLNGGALMNIVGDAGVY
jgi:phosphoglycerate dehydrogenase-like enzyme